jgi:hypothetical protein
MSGLRTPESATTLLPRHTSRGPSDNHPRSASGQARTLLIVSDYEWLVELAAKGMAERDNHPMPKSVTTPEEFYEVMARAALDAISLRALLDGVGALRAEREVRITEEAPTQAVNAETATTPDNKPPVSTKYTLNAPPALQNGWEDGALDTKSRDERATRKAENIRLRRKWANTAEERLAVVTAAVERLRKVLDIERETPSDAFAEVASEVVAACGHLAEWLGGTRGPRGFAKAEGELGAAAGVYLNAAVAVRRLEEVDGYKRLARSNACAMLLAQGDHHVDSFLAAVVKKLRDDVAVEKRSTGAAETPGGLEGRAGT